MMTSTTCSFWIPGELRVHLELTARYLGKGKSWIINRALEEYLAKMGHDALASEARRQSLLASGAVFEEEKFWQERAGAAGGDLRGLLLPLQ